MKSAIEVTMKKAAWRLFRRLGSFVPRDIETRMSLAEEDLFERFQTPADIVPIVFILASPRTGSTLLYQLMAKYLRLHFFSNYVTDYFPTYPLVGTVIESAITHNLAEGISLRNRYGETKGPHEPNEATKIIDNWFPHEHPSEAKSTQVRRGQRSHLTSTMAGITAFTGAPIVVKNAWNCFRVKELVSVFPSSRFIWLRRDIASSSYSALQARRRQGDPAKIWNSASPANYAEIRRLPCIEQVIEQQFWTNDAVEKSLRQYVPAENVAEVWYEDIVANPLTALIEIAEHVPHPRLREFLQNSTVQDLDLQPSRQRIQSDEFDQILRFSTTKYPELIRQ